MGRTMCEFHAGELVYKIIDMLLTDDRMYTAIEIADKLNTTRETVYRKLRMMQGMASYTDNLRVVSEKNGITRFTIRIK